MVATRIQAWSVRNASSPWLSTFSRIQGLLFLHLLEAHVSPDKTAESRWMWLCMCACVHMCMCKVSLSLSVLRDWPRISEINLFLSKFTEKIENYSILGKTLQACFYIKQKGSPIPAPRSLCTTALKKIPLQVLASPTEENSPGTKDISSLRSECRNRV